MNRYLFSSLISMCLSFTAFAHPFSSLEKVCNEDVALWERGLLLGSPARLAPYNVKVKGRVDNTIALVLPDGVTIGGVAVIVDTGTDPGFKPHTRKIHRALTKMWGSPSTLGEFYLWSEDFAGVDTPKALQFIGPDASVTTVFCEE